MKDYSEVDPLIDATVATLKVSFMTAYNSGYESGYSEGITAYKSEYESKGDKSKRMDILDIKSAVNKDIIRFFVEDNKIFCKWYNDNGERVCVGNIETEEGDYVP